MNALTSALIKHKPLLYIQLIFQKRVMRSTIKLSDTLKLSFHNKKGIEIGGPSNMFKLQGQLPIYNVASIVDGCNFSDDTPWEGKINIGKTYNYDGTKMGYQFICDGVDVPIIPKNQYDFVLSCNNLEHIANPLKAIDNWLKLLKPNGTIVMVLPRKESNFDHKRPITSMAHLIEDFEKNIGEDDLTHLDEILQLHDLKYDPLAGNFEEFKTRSLDNFNNRCLHHHVFDTNLLEQICTYFGLKVVLKASRIDNHFIIATK